MNQRRIFAESPTAKKAADIFIEQLQKRSILEFSFCETRSEADFVFELDESITDESFQLKLKENSILFRAGRLRSLIYAFAAFLKNSQITDGIPVLIESVDGIYAPAKRIRGHQMGYRTTPNSYDAWDYEQYRQYYTDILLMGCNTVEHIPYERGVSKRNRLMKYDEEEFLINASAMAKELDIDVSLWMPNCEENAEEAYARRELLFSKIPHLHYVFPPGGDPGELEPDELLERCEQFRRILKKYHPHAQVWPSAQQPHAMPFWGEDFLAALQKRPDSVDGIITGPNRAFDLDVLRQRLPERYDIRLYPDITHNVRCEYPVHFDRDDWHYTFTTALSRECINPRPSEYKKLHERTRGYVVGSVSYSEGINDDVNKFVWSSLDFDPDLTLREIMQQYAALFFPEGNAASIADAILALEKNWEGDPADNPHIERTLQMWIDIGNQTKAFSENWRYNTMLFRACCDVYIQRKYIYENRLLKNAVRELLAENTEKAAEILSAELPDSCTTLRRTIQFIGEKLFDQIGLQLDVEHFCADNPERGATFDTIDLPISDKKWLLLKIEESKHLPAAAQQAFLKRIINRNRVEKDEIYFSFALHELQGLGTLQKPDFYMNFQGDRPHINNGSLPVCMFKLYDHFSLSFKGAGLASHTDYVLQITYKEPPNTMTNHHKVCINSETVFEGKQFGGYRNADFEKEMLPQGYAAVCYDIDSSLIKNGCIEFEITEPMIGFQICEFKIIKKINL